MDAQIEFRSVTTKEITDSNSTSTKGTTGSIATISTTTMKTKAASEDIIISKMKSVLKSS